MQSKPSQWSSGLVDDATPEMGNWDEWEAFMASDQATKELDPEDVADAEDFFAPSEVTTLPPAQDPHGSPPLHLLTQSPYFQNPLHQEFRFRGYVIMHVRHG